MSDTCDNNIGFTPTANLNNSLKKPYRIGNKTFVVIDERLVERLRINEENVWLEEEESADGVLLRIRHI
jgi:hypothetical protein